MRGRKRTTLEGNEHVIAVYGPWYKPQRQRWSLTLVYDSGARSSATFKTEAEAISERDGWRKLQDSRATANIEAALKAYEAWRKTEGRKEKSTKETLRRLRKFFEPTDKLFVELGPTWGQKRYDELSGAAARQDDVRTDFSPLEVGTSPLGQANSGRAKRANGVTPAMPKPGQDRPAPHSLAVDSHRNYLAEAKTFVKWCSERGYCPADLLVNVKPTGQRRHGKPQLRINELRRWMAVAQMKAATEPGALAAMMALTMGLRASEIVQRVVRDVDDDCNVLWITDDAEGQTLKTTAARRRVDIPDEVRPFLQRWIEGKEQGAWIFPGRYGHDGRYKTGHVDRNQVTKWIKKICKEAKVPLVCAHGMRGSHATLGTLDQIKALAAKMGHESDATTRQSYIDPQALQQVAQQSVLRVLRGGRK